VSVKGFSDTYKYYTYTHVLTSYSHSQNL